ncbi:unnamed protein product [Oikopleura dioica]|uniref:Uncharacterized protein n=1 Tax=Oikopleura dioica TaxID=34765 RepID=E4YN48_OIKDI|nr:unnamed protein product [Oikopleura dioica]
MADRRVKDEAKRASSLKREADSPDKSYVFESNSRNELVDQRQTRQRKKQKLQVSPIRANIVSTPDREKRYDKTDNSTSRIELSIDDRCDAPFESTFHSAVTSVEAIKELNEPTVGRTKKPQYDRIKKNPKKKKQHSPFDPAPIEKIHLPSEGRDSSVHLNLLSSWQNLIIDEGHKEMSNSTDEIPQSWGWSASREDRKLGNDLRLSRVRTERTKNLLAELKRIDFDPDMEVLPKWRDCKNPCETSWNEIETESDDEQNHFQTSTQPNRFFKKMNSSEIKKDRSKYSYSAENYKSLFRPEEPEVIKKQETNPAKLKRIEDQNWDMLDDDLSQKYFCRSLKLGRGKKGRGRTTSDSLDVKEKKETRKKIGEKCEKKADTKTLFISENIHKIIKDEEEMVNDYNYRLDCEEHYYEIRKKPQNVLRNRVWQYCKDFSRYAAESIYDNPDYDDRHELQNHLNLFDSQYLGYLPGDAIAMEFICDDRKNETVGYYDDEQTGETLVDFKEDEEGHFYGVSFKEGNNWTNMDPIVKDMVSALVREIFKSLKELETDIV